MFHQSLKKKICTTEKSIRIAEPLAGIKLAVNGAEQHNVVYINDFQ